MEIEIRHIDDIKPYPGNPRVIPQMTIDVVAKSIQQFGWRQPIVTDADGVIIAGHGRYLAAQSLGLGKVPVHVAHDMTPEDAKRYRLADNRAAEFSHFDADMLAAELDTFADLEIDLEIPGFDPREIETILAVHEAMETPGQEADVKQKEKFKRLEEQLQDNTHSEAVPDAIGATQPESTDNYIKLWFWVPKDKVAEAREHMQKFLDA